MFRKTLTPFVSIALATAAFSQEPSIERLDPALDALLDPAAPIGKLAEGFEWSEGPVWYPETGELLFSDIPNNIIHAWKESTGLRVFMKPSGYTGVADYGSEPGSNGLAVDTEGRLLFCEHGDRRISRLSKGGGKMTVADRFEGKRFNSPNDIAVHPDGTLFFTDPIYGLPGKEKDPARELDFCGVFRIATDGAVTLLTKEIERPNGIALSPDRKTLYVANSHGPRPFIFAMALKEDATAGAAETFFDTKGLSGRGAPDGLKVDAAGNLWATGPGGLLIISPQGKLLGRVLTHRATANVAFGGGDGKSVFLTADDRLLRFSRK
jgi:gluconolactonase